MTLEVAVGTRLPVADIRALSPEDLLTLIEIVRETHGD
jgi:hypothetical protein